MSSQNVEEAGPGDIVLFRYKDMLVTHRVVKRLFHNDEIKWVTRGDRVLRNDTPISRHELLGRVTVIERGKRRLTPRQSPAARVAAWVLSRSEFATKVALKIRDTGLGKRDTGKDVRSSVFGV